ncbi:MAG: hypothetical protein K6G08_03515 [Prevotella sp.]|nr:hypothetical protein [Prevotella sp.]
MKKKLLMQLVAVACSVSAYAAYNVGDYIYSSTAKYKIVGTDLITNGSFNQGDGTQDWTNATGGVLDGETWGIETSVGPNGENAIKSLAANYDSEQGSSTLARVLPLPKGFYTISFWVKSPSVLTSTITGAGSTNYLNFFINDTGDNTVTTSVATPATFSTDWSQVVFNVESPSDETFLVFNAYNIAQDVMFTNFEVHQAVEVYDTRIAERYIKGVEKLLAEPDFADGAGEILGMLDMVKGELAQEPEDGTSITGLMEEFDPFFQEYINSKAGNTVGRRDADNNLIESYLTSWTTWGYYNWNNLGSRGTWTFEGGRWGFSPNNGDLERPLDDGYVASAGIQTSYNLEVGLRIAANTFNNTSINKAGRYMFSVEAQAVAALNKQAPYGANPSIVIAEPSIWAGKDTTVFVADTLSSTFWKRYYTIVDITEDDIANGTQVSAGFLFPRLGNGTGGRYSLRNPEFRVIGKSQEEIDHLYGYDQLQVQQNALKARVDSCIKINAYTQADGYPWGHKVLQDSIDKYAAVYADLLTVVDAEGNELQPERVTLQYKDEILNAVRMLNNAIGNFYRTNRSYQTLIADIAICNTALNAEKNAAGDKGTFQTAITKAQGLVDATQIDADEVEAFDAEDIELLTAKETFEKGVASRANPANLYVQSKNLNFESWTSKSTYSSDQTVNGWNITIGADGKQWDIQPNGAYEFGHRASIWRGTSVGPNGRMQQTIKITTPGVYEFRSRAFSAEYGDGAKWDQYMAIANICGSDFDPVEFIDTPVDTIYHPNVRLFFGPEGATNDSITLTKCAPADFLRNSDSVLVYTRETPMNYSVIYVKTSSEEETVEFGLEAFENGKDAGASTFGFGDNRLYYLGPEAAYNADTETEYNATVEKAKGLIAQYTRDHADAGWIVIKLMRLVGDANYPWAEGLSYTAPTTIQEKQNIILTLNEYIDMLNLVVNPELLGIEEMTTAAQSVARQQKGTYTLSGVRVSGKNLPAGLYIINGKKVLVK